MRKLLFASLYALVVAGFGFAIAANITRSVQLSQDPSGPIGFDTQSSVYFPTHANNSGSAPLLQSCTTSSVIAGTDMGGVITEGTGASTGCSMNFRTAYASTPFCTASSANAASPVGVNASPNGVQFTHASNTPGAGGPNWFYINYICVGGNLG